MIKAHKHITNTQHALITTAFYAIFFIFFYASNLKDLFVLLRHDPNWPLTVWGFCFLAFLFSFFLDETVSRTILTCVNPYAVLLTTVVIGKLLITNSTFFLIAEIAIIPLCLIIFALQDKGKKRSESADDFLTESLGKIFSDLGEAFGRLFKAFFILFAMNIPVGVVILITG